MSQTSTMDTGRAIAILACHVVAHAWRDVQLTDYGGWENFPEIGERDWAAIVEKADTLAASLDMDKTSVTEAYEHLAARAGVDV